MSLHPGPVPRPGVLVHRPGAFAASPAVVAWLGGPSPEAPAGVRVRLDPALAPEGYALDVDVAGIDIRGGSPAGVHHAVQTLRQLLPAHALRRAPLTGGPLPVPAVHLED